MADFLTFMHIFFLAFLLSGIGVANYATIRGARTEDVKEFSIYLQMANRAGMMIPIALIAMGIFGVLAAWEIGYSLTDGWLIAAYITIVVALVVPGATFARWGAEADKLMPEALEKGEITPRIKELTVGPKARAVELFMFGLLIFILFDMVYKPF